MVEVPKRVEVLAEVCREVPVEAFKAACPGCFRAVFRKLGDGFAHVNGIERVRDLGHELRRQKGGGAPKPS